MCSCFLLEFVLPFIPNLKNGPIPNLIDPPIKKNGNNTMHMQIVKKRMIMIGILYTKFSLPVE